MEAPVVGCDRTVFEVRAARMVGRAEQRWRVPTSA